MIKNFLLKTLKKLIIFFNNRLKIKSQPSSPADLYFEDVAFYILEKWSFIFWRSGLLYFGEVAFIFWRSGLLYFGEVAF